MKVEPVISTHQRSAGHASARFAQRSGCAAVMDLRQNGSAKAIVLPPSEIVFLNTSGGLTGGDRLEYRLCLGAGCRMTATTQTAERAYRSTSGIARMSVDLTVGEGAHLEWLPQETILFDRAQLRRRTQITLAADATCLMAEAVVLGRAAMGETVTALDFHDWRQVQRGDTAVHLEAFYLNAARLAAGTAGLDGARAFATVVMVAPNAADALVPVRAALGCAQVRAAASAIEDRLVIRLMASDGWPLRRKLAEILTLLRRAPLPRVWQI